MTNLLDYLTWRGDLTLETSPFNEVDGLILCELVFADLTGIVPSPAENAAVRVKDAADRYFAGRENENIRLGLLIPKDVPPLFKKLRDSARFRDMLLFGYVNNVDRRREEQFSALSVELTDGTQFIAFRGTDDTIVGWKENFNMSYLASVPAQIDAVSYVGDAASKSDKPLRIGGHSKGGNLAVYAAMKNPPEVQARIANVFNYDGPGFRQNVMNQACYTRIRDKVTTIVPQSSLVGMLLEHEDTYEVVKSTAVGPYQHDGFSWEVLGTGFVHLESVTNNCKYVDKTLKTWVANMDETQRKRFVDTLFDLLDSTGATTLTELTDAKIKNTLTLIENMRQLDKETKQMLLNMLGLLIKAGAPAIPRLRLDKARFLTKPKRP